MNVLVIHSASSQVIKKVVSQIANKDNVYVLTFPKNRGTFSSIAKELYFEKDDIRISAYKVVGQVRKIIKEKKIDYLIGAYSNNYGTNYENLRVLFSKIKVYQKEIYNRRLEKVTYKCTFKEKLIEFYYTYEIKILPVLNAFLKLYRKCTKTQPEQIKKIMFINNTYGMGGVETLLYEWGNCLSKAYTVICVCDTNGEIYNMYRESNIVTYLHREKVYNEACSFNFYYYIKKVMKKEKPDAVIIAGADTILPATLASIFAKVPKIIKINNGVFYEVMNNKPVGMQLRLFSDFYHSIIAVSNSVRNNIHELGIKEHLIRVIYGSSIDVNNIKRKNYEVIDEMNTDKKNVVCISRLSAEKGVDVFIKAISCIDKDTLDQLRFFIIGDGPEKNTLIELSQKLSVGKYVSFMGFRNDIDNILNSSYITVLSSHTEGLPLCILESMAMSKVCICSNVGGIPEIIEHDKNGFLFEDGNYKELAHYITICVNNENMLQKMQETAYDTIKNKFDINVIIKDINNLIH